MSVAKDLNSKGVGQVSDVIAPTTHFSRLVGYRNQNLVRFLIQGHGSRAGSDLDGFKRAVFVWRFLTDDGYHPVAAGPFAVGAEYEVIFGIEGGANTSSLAGWHLGDQTPIARIQ